MRYDHCVATAPSPSDKGLNPVTQKPAEIIRYRIKDNYSRFYLKYIEPNAEMIDRDAFRCRSLDSLPGWDAMMGCSVCIVEIKASAYIDKFVEFGTLYK